jgi:hypothetical protein
MENSDNTSSIEINLVRAQKYLTKLKTFLDSSKDQYGRVSQFNPESMFHFEALLHGATSFENLKDSINEKVNELKKDFQTRVNIMNDFKNLKDLVHSKNTETGLDRILSEIELNQKFIEFYKKMYMQCKSTPLLTNDTLLSVYNDYRKSLENKSDFLFTAYNYRFYTNDELNNKIKELTKSNETLENKRDTINASTKINLIFSPDTLEILGL